jgi:hypothetical protein
MGNHERGGRDLGEIADTPEDRFAGASGGGRISATFSRPVRLSFQERMRSVRRMRASIEVRDAI